MGFWELLTGANNEETPPIIEEARGDSVTAEYLLREKPDSYPFNLSEKPVIEYLGEEEQPHYLLRSEESGLTIKDERNTEEKPPSYKYASFCVVTDDKVHFLISGEKSDTHITLSYSEISRCRFYFRDRYYQAIFDTDKIEYIFEHDKEIEPKELRSLKQFVSEKADQKSNPSSSKPQDASESEEDTSDARFLKNSISDRVRLESLHGEIGATLRKSRKDLEAYRAIVLCRNGSSNSERSRLVLSTHRLLELKIGETEPVTELDLKKIADVATEKPVSSPVVTVKTLTGSTKKWRISADGATEFKTMLIEATGGSVPQTSRGNFTQLQNLSNAGLQARLQEIDNYQFEHFIADLWEKQGWSTKVTTATEDAGVDVFATKDGQSRKQAIQVKRYGGNTTVGGPAIQQYASLQLQFPEVDEVVVVTTSSFTSSALKRAQELNVKTVDGRELAARIQNEGRTELVSEYLTR